MGGACSTYGERRDAYRVLVGETEGKKPLGRQITELADCNLVLSMGIVVDGVVIRGLPYFDYTDYRTLDVSIMLKWTTKQSRNPIAIIIHEAYAEVKVEIHEFLTPALQG
jgi:hypothetical protein